MSFIGFEFVHNFLCHIKHRRLCNCWCLCPEQEPLVELLCDFFDEKMSEILAGISEHVYCACPVGYAPVPLNSIEEMAKCIIEYGVKTDLEIYHSDGTFLCSTCGIFLNKVIDNL